jgi:hypothetical protein
MRHQRQLGRSLHVRMVDEFYLHQQRTIVLVHCQDTYSGVYDRDDSVDPWRVSIGPYYKKMAAE